MTIFGIDIRVYFLLFLTYSFLGWLIEVIGKLIQYKRFVNRGFLIGPYCPIYGTGALLITLLLKSFINMPIILFFMAILVCGILEYLTSYFMEKIYHARWWDYSQKRFNINGRVCLDTIIPFGLLGMLIMYVLNPMFIARIESLPEKALNISFWALLAIFLIDNIISGNIIGYIGKTTKEIGKELDNTEEITKQVKDLLIAKSSLYRRLLNAYPKIQLLKVKIKEKKEKIEKQIKEQKNEIQESIKKQKEEIKEKINDLKENKQ